VTEVIKFATVDDGDAEAKIFSRIFRGHGAAWQHYGEYDAAVSAIDAGAFDDAELILLDIQLHEDDEAGYRLVKAIRQRGIPGTVVMLSVSEMDEMICKCFRQGASAYIVKPLSDKDLEKVVNHLKSLGPHARKCPTTPSRQPASQ